ncbi:MAG: hypothetical protein JJE19_08850, partial [Methanosarcinales archaeon]|nr:hypothetical protein [Methanosarcinales archaeon]
STFYHQLRSVLIKLFKSLMVEKTYKHKPIYLIAKEEEFLMKSMLFGKKLVSVPFGPYGGVCADNRTIENAPVEEAKRITKARLDARSKIAIITKAEKIRNRDIDV